ncbi:MAG: hypothetical protein KIT58_09870 [Planctomycetota bacterium]|nr:hypothetical protein [Planctomycetota bacterium]
MPERIVRCPTCHEDRPVNAFGRCCVCGVVVAEVNVQAPSTLAWHLRQNVALYAGATLLAVAAGLLLLGPQPATWSRPLIRALVIIGGVLIVGWIKARLVG